MTDPTQKPRTIGRVVAAVLSWLVIGAVVNVLVAWSTSVGIAGATRGFISPANGSEVWQHEYGLTWGTPDAVTHWGSWNHSRDVAMWNLPRSSDKQSTPMVLVDRFGFPFRALQRVWIVEPPQSQSVHEWVIQTRWLEANLPLRPLVSGFTLNTIAYTMIAWGLWHGTAAVFAWSRRKPWQCRDCRYDRRGIAGTAPCPECGSTPSLLNAHPQP